MKDYSLSKEEKQKFVLFFNETEEELIVHYASGEVKPVKKTPRAKRELLTQMEEQVRQSAGFKKHIEETIKKQEFFEAFNKVLVLVNGIYLIDGFWQGNIPPNLLILFVGAVGITKYYHGLIKTYEEVAKDIEKNEMYLEFAEIREEESARILVDIYSEAKKRGATIEELKQIPLSLENLDEEININTIHKTSYKEMKKMLENAERLRRTEFFLNSKRPEEYSEKAYLEMLKETLENKKNENIIRQRSFKMFQFKTEEENK